MTLGTVIHHAALAVAVASLLGAGVRVASLAAPSGLERAIAAVVLAAAAAVVEALGLGLVSLGASPVALVAAALATWLATRRFLPHPAVSVQEELTRWWRRLTTGEALAIGALTGAWAAWTAWLLAHPALGHDMVLYHLGEAVSWVHNGRPGSILPIVTPLRVGSYPLTHEVLLEWGLAIGRGFPWATLVTAAVPALTAVASYAGLRQLTVSRAAAGLGAAALVATPAVVASQSGGASVDPAALAWLACCGALAIAAVRRPALLGPAVVAGGLAAGTKTTALPLAVTVLAITAFAVRRELRPFVPGLSAAAGLALAAGGVWFIRDLVQHGSPLWPFASFPGGDPRPPIYELADVTFLDRPADTLSRLGTYYWEHFGGPLILLCGALVAAALARTRAVVFASIATVASVLLWMNAPFTGVLASSGLDSGTGDTTRYLLPGVVAAVLAIALASRSARLRALTLSVLGAAAAVGLYETFDLGFPNAPSPWTPLAGAAIGAVAAAALARARLPALPRSAVAAAALTVVAVAGAAAADGYVERHGRATETPSRVAVWLAGQPRWRDGQAPVASTFSLLAPLAGDRLRHRLVLVEDRSACARAAALRAWLVLTLHASRRARGCGAPQHSDDDVAVYAPPG
jgi:hypothetical protein